MNRCLQLAKLGAGYAAPNPIVGAVLVYNDIIVGEGYHQHYGGPHAEVNCINSVVAENKQFICKSIMYVSLEPCAHFGKTPPCSDLIIQHQIPQVVIGCRDSFEKVNGHGIHKLKEAGVNVTEGVLEKEAQELNKRFFTFHEKKQPYIFLKWAQSNDGFMAKQGFEKVAISNEISNRYTHRLRSHEAAIMVGTNTALYDNPSLTGRLWPGNNPVRIIIDKQLRLSQDSAVFDENASVIILNHIKEEKRTNIYFHKIDENENLLHHLMQFLYENNLNSLIVEGGAVLLQSFIQQSLWDEAIVITNNTLNLVNGIVAPSLPREKQVQYFSLSSDQIKMYRNQ